MSDAAAELKRVTLARERERGADNELWEARQELRAAMRAAREAGASLQAIGFAAGISRQRVAELLREG